MNQCINELLTKLTSFEPERMVVLVAWLLQGWTHGIPDDASSPAGGCGPGDGT